MVEDWRNRCFHGVFPDGALSLIILVFYCCYKKIITPFMPSKSTMYCPTVLQVRSPVWLVRVSEKAQWALLKVSQWWNPGINRAVILFWVSWVRVHSQSHSSCWKNLGPCGCKTEVPISWPTGGVVGDDGEVGQVTSCRCLNSILSSMENNWSIEARKGHDLICS